MSKAVIALTMATVASAGASTYLWQELGEEREQTVALQTRLAELEQTRAPVLDDAPAVEPAPVEEPVEAPAAQPATASAPPPPRGTFTAQAMPGAGVVSLARPGVMDPEMRRRMRESHEQQVRMLKDPEYRALMRAQHKLGMQQGYADLEPLLGLSKEESEQLLDTLAEQAIRNMEERPMFADMDGTPPSEAEIRERQRHFEEQRRRNESEIAAVLGPRYGEWQEYQQNGWSRSQVMNLRQALSSTNEPLRQDQVKPLVEAIAREQKQMQSWSMRSVSGPQGRPDAEAQARMAEEWLERTARSHERIRTAVSGLLTPAQYEQFEQRQQQELKMQELSVRQQRARADAIARGELPQDASGAFNSVVTYSN